MNTIRSKGASALKKEDILDNPEIPVLEKLQSLSGSEFLELRKSGELDQILGSESREADIHPDVIFKNIQDVWPLIEKASQDHQLEAALIVAIMVQESGGRQDARSSTKASGLMQLTSWIYQDSTDYPGAINPFRPEEAIPRAAQHLSTLRHRYRGNLEKILAAYNQGEPAVNEAIAKAKNKKDGSWKDQIFHNTPKRRTDVLNYLTQVKGILQGEDKRLLPEILPYLKGGADMVKDKIVPSPQEWQEKQKAEILSRLYLLSSFEKI